MFLVFLKSFSSVGGTPKLGVEGLDITLLNLANH